MFIVRHTHAFVGATAQTHLCIPMPRDFKFCTTFELSTFEQYGVSRLLGPLPVVAQHISILHHNKVTVLVDIPNMDCKNPCVALSKCIQMLKIVTDAAACDNSNLQNLCIPATA